MTSRVEPVVRPGRSTLLPWIHIGVVGAAVLVFVATLRPAHLEAVPPALVLVLAAATLVAASRGVQFSGGYMDMGITLYYVAVFLMPAPAAGLFAGVGNTAASFLFWGGGGRPWATRLSRSLANGATYALMFYAGGVALRDAGGAVPLTLASPADFARLLLVLVVVRVVNDLLLVPRRLMRGERLRLLYGAARGVVILTEGICGLLGAAIALTYKPGDPTDPAFVLLCAVFSLGVLGYASYMINVERLRRRVESMQAIQKISQAIGGRSHLDELLETIHRELQQVISFDAFWVGQLRRRVNKIEFLISYDRGHRQPKMSLPVGYGVPAWVIEQKRPLLCRNTREAQAELGADFSQDMPISLIAVPLLVDGDVIGILSVYSYRDDAYTPDDLAFLEGLAVQLVIALGNVRILQVLRDLSRDLERKVAARTQELSTINEISREVAAILDVQKLVDRFVELASGLTEAEVVAVGLIDDAAAGDDPPLVCHASRGYADDYGWEPLYKQHQGLAGVAMERRAPVLVNDITRVPDYFPIPLAGGGTPRSELAVPLVRQDRVLGAIVLESSRVDYFTVAHRDLLETLAGQIAVAIDNARLYQRTLGTLDELTRAQAQLEAISDISREIAAILDTDELLRRVGERVREVINTEVFAVFLVDEAGDESGDADAAFCVCRHFFGYEPGAVAGLRLRMDEGITGRAMRERRGLIVGDVSADADYVGAPFVNGKRARSELAVPLVVKDRVLGSVVMESSEPDFFQPIDLGLLETLAGQIAVALENARLYQATVQTLEELQATQAQLVRSESLAAIGQLVAGVAHELNNPIGAARSLMQSTMEVLEESEGDFAEAIDDLQFSTTQLDRAKGIIRSLLDVSRQTPTLDEPVDLNQAARDAITVLYNKYKYTEAEIEAELADSLPPVYGNFAQIAQVCLNIVQNAIQALPDHRGRVTLRTGSIQAPAETGADRQAVFFECEDNGVGIPEGIRNDLFKPFFTTKEVGVGTGLGLYICHEIVKRHNGHIDFTTAVGAGTTFRILLPVGQSHAAASGEESGAPS